MDKTQALKLFNDQYPQVLDDCRYIARHLAVRNPRHEVTIDDVHDHYKLPEWITPKMFGAVFKDGDKWEAVGYVKSRRPIAHKRPVTIWRYKLAPMGQGSFL